MEQVFGSCFCTPPDPAKGSCYEQVSPIFRRATGYGERRDNEGEGGAAGYMQPRG